MARRAPPAPEEELGHLPDARPPRASGCRRRRRGRRRTSAATACSTSAAAGSPTTRTSRRARASTSASTSTSTTRIADLLGPVEDLPVEDASFEVVLCTQVLEHAGDPDQAVSELHRVTTPGRARARLDARRAGLPPGARGPLALDAHAASSSSSCGTATGRSVEVHPAGGTATCLAAMTGIYVDMLFRRVHLTPIAKGLVWLLNTTGAALDRRVAGAPRDAARLDLPQLPRRRGETGVSREPRARHRRRRVHRLEPRPRAARARRLRARPRQLLDRQPRQPRRARRRDRRGRAAELRARAQRRARERGRLPPRRARLRAALRPGPADDERRQRRGHAQRPARRAGRGRAPRRLRLVLVGVRQLGRAAGARDRALSTRSRPTASPSSRPSATASPSAASTTRSRPSCCGYFNVFGPRQNPHSQYAAAVPLFITAIADRRAR